MHTYAQRIARRLGLHNCDVDLSGGTEHRRCPARLTVTDVEAVVRTFERALGDVDLHGPDAERALIELKLGAGSRFPSAIVGEFLTVYRQDALDQLLSTTSSRAEGEAVA